MSALPPVPLAARPLAEFPGLLRSAGFAVAPEQTVTFMAAVTLLGPKAFADVRRAAYATLAPPQERRAEFDALFEAFFCGRVHPSVPASCGGSVVKQERGGSPGPAEPSRTGESGGAATQVEQLARRLFLPLGPDQHLGELARRASRALPRRRAVRRIAAKSGDLLDLPEELAGVLHLGGVR